jgi:hypothetical protein
MSLPSISLLLPTRERPGHVDRLFKALTATTAEIAQLEVVAYVDQDDPASHDIAHSPLRVETLIRSPGATMGAMIRTCYEASRGRYVMLINDDVVFRTPAWDVRVIDAFAEFPDDVALVYGNDLDQGRSRPTFPIVSRTVCEVIGTICPRGYWGLHIESHLFDIFRQLARLGSNRIVYLEDVVFEHTHYTSNRDPKLDATYRHRNKQNDDVLFISLDHERRRSAGRLHRFITSGATHGQPAEQVTCSSSSDVINSASVDSEGDERPALRGSPEGESAGRLFDRRS